MLVSEAVRRHVVVQTSSFLLTPWGSILLCSNPSGCDMCTDIAAGVLAMVPTWWRAPYYVVAVLACPRG